MRDPGGATQLSHRERFLTSLQSSANSTSVRHSKHRHVESSLSLTEKQVKQQLERILASDLFTRSERLSKFLRYVVDQALQGQAAELKEYSIALAVFDRLDSFDNRFDPIVRVEAGRLRAKIREYYDTVGEHDPLWIGLGKPGYEPVFKARKTQPQRAASAELRVGESVEYARADGKRAPKRGTDEFSIAVLPFVDLSADQRQAYFCEALADQIINALAKIRKLRVTGRTSVLQFKDKAEDVREIGRRLKVDCVLEGSVQKVEKRVRVNVQLLSAADGLDVWGDTYDRPLEDVFVIQDEITQAVVDGLETTLFPATSPTEQPRKHRGRNPTPRPGPETF